MGDGNRFDSQTGLVFTHALKRTEGATRQKPYALSVLLNSRG
jgi:hypothetical protein